MSNSKSNLLTHRRRLILAGAVAALAAGAQTLPALASAAPLTGQWGYRRFIDSPDSAESLDKLRLAVATFGLQANLGGIFTGYAATKRWRLSLVGQVDGNGRVTMQTTQVDLKTVGWNYEYIGWLTPQWPQANQLRGGVSKCGSTYSFVAVKS